MFLRVGLAVPMLMLFFFLPAGTWDYWEAWAYMGVILIPMFFAIIYLTRTAPDLIERRMRLREKEAAQKKVINLSVIYFLIVFLLPGFDQRFGWSHPPAWIVILADLIVLIGYGIIILVFRENHYASRIIEVEADQKVIRTGPYAIVRHPMYVGSILMYTLSPLALGSLWALIPGLLIIPLLVSRILNEEEVLKRDLKGYSEYTEQVKYRLIPGMW